MIAIIDYNAGNLYSVDNALRKLNIPFFCAKRADDLKKADKIILPGVGAFSAAARELKKYDMFDALCENKKPLLGICLGMQLLFDYSNEIENTKGLALIEGYVDKIQTDLLLPHIGWNNLNIKMENKLTTGIKQNASVYFVHSYKAICEQKYIIADCDYDEQIPAIVAKGNIYGCQFHPEKSSKIGLEILSNFAKL